jgi:hypothetical protein
VLVENEVLEVLARVFPLNVELRLVEQGIAVKHANQPQVERIVKMPIDVRDRVWEWIQNPKVVTEKEWVELREPITLVIFKSQKLFGNIVLLCSVKCFQECSRSYHSRAKFVD